MPTLVEVRTELPKSLVGKVLRRILVEEEVTKQQEAEQATDAAQKSEAEKQAA